MSMIFDLGREESLASICLEPDRYSRSSLSRQSTKVPIDAIMSEETLRAIYDERLSDLPFLYHNLMTDKAL